jgi:AraC family transcriptional regulator
MATRLRAVEDWERLAADAAFDPAGMAALCFVSLRQLERFFQQQFNMTPRHWNCALRCRIAVQLISQGWSTKAVARELKFADESHFCHFFKRSVGAAPQSFAPVYRREECRSQTRMSLPDNAMPSTAA